MEKQVEKVSARAGSLIVWMGEQPHCNYPNDSSRFRINQYVKMFPAQEGGQNTDVRTKVIEEMIAKMKIPVTPLGRRMLGLDLW
jgi:hypothetical protein